MRWIAVAISLSLGWAWAAQAADCYNVATWNLEHYGFGKSRGFPENTRGGPSYPGRTAAQRDAIAETIRDRLDAKILVLNEINGVLRRRSSEELDDLTERLGGTWKYHIGLKGGRGDSQRVALLWDTRFAKAKALWEVYIRRTMVDGDDIFDRDPLMGLFALIRGSQEMNDLVVVGLHLASGHRAERLEVFLSDEGRAIRPPSHLAVGKIARMEFEQVRAFEL